MCGVYGYIGENKKNLSGFLLDGMKKLEYRGYDSAGISILTGYTFNTQKAVGEIDKLKTKVKHEVGGTVGIGHTRWATHGGVTVENSHPHLDCTGKVVVVHNGIIENYEELRVPLQRSHKFVSETDTEVVSHLIEDYLASGLNFADAVGKTFRMLSGLNAIIAIHGEQIVAYRNGSPLVVGVIPKGFIVSSDLPTLNQVTKEIILLNDNEGIILTKSSAKIIDAKGKEHTATPKIFNIASDEIGKGTYEHFLLKEIHDQPEVLKAIYKKDNKEIIEGARMIRDAWGTYFCACGTAAYAGLAATYLFSEVAKKHVNFAISSEFPYLEDFLVRDSLLIVASQSGETMDTLEAVRAAKRHNSKILALTNVPGSTLSRMADHTISLDAGSERAVLSTKSYVAKLAIFTLLSYTLDGGYDKGLKFILEASKESKKFLASSRIGQIQKLATKLSKAKNIYLIGRGVNYPTALEGALKIKEATYIHAEGFAGGELKHGSIALIESGTPVIAIVSNDRTKESTISNAIETKSRGAYVIGISPTDHDAFDEWIEVPDLGIASVITNVIPLQLLAYYMTVKLGKNPDRPRNLAKSVTVK